MDFNESHIAEIIALREQGESYPSISKHLAKKYKIHMDDRRIGEIVRQYARAPGARATNNSSQSQDNNLKLLAGGKLFKRILILPDLHFPFADWAGIHQAAAWAQTHKPDLVIQLGDFFDQKAWSRFPKDVDDYSPQLEWDMAESDAKRMYKLFPNMQILVGNHDSRAMRKAAEVGLPQQMIKALDSMFGPAGGYKGWHWHLNSSEKLVVNTVGGPVLFLHGDELGGNAIQISRRLGMNVIMGHTHQHIIGSTTTLKDSIYGMECGALMDGDSKGARYASRNPVGFAQGFGVIDNGVPYFIKKGLPPNSKVKK